MIYIYLLVCFLLYLTCSHETMASIGICNDNMAGAFTYLFAHATLLHLAINALCLHLMYRPIHRMYCVRFGPVSDMRFFSFCAWLAILAAFPAATDTPTVGASGFVFVLLGMLLVLNPTRQQLMGYIYVALALIIQLIFGKSNVALHICAFITGALFIIFRIAYDRARNTGEE